MHIGSQQEVEKAETDRRDNGETILCICQSVVYIGATCAIWSKRAIVLLRHRISLIGEI